MKRSTVWIIAAGAAALVAAAAVVWLLIPRTSSAEEQALAYFSALADGDLKAVQARGVGVGVESEAEEAFLAASEYPSAATVESAAEEASSTTVTVSYRLGDETLASEIVMIERAGQWVPEPTSAVGAVTFDTAVAIGDAIVPSGTEIALLPAAYDVVAAPAGFLGGSASFPVLPGSDQYVQIDTTLRPEATALAQNQLDGYAESCTQTAAAVPASCGIAIAWAADFTTVSEISYRIEQMPTVALTPDAFQADAGILVATVTGIAFDGSEQSLTYRTTTWSLRGDVTFTADDIVLSVW